MTSGGNTPADGPLAILLRIVSVWGLLLLLVLLIVVFTILKPDTFPTAFTFQTMANARSINALVAIAFMIPLITNNFDLSVASVLGIAQILAIGLQSELGLDWVTTSLLVIATGAFVGLVNGLLITRVKIDSFIATLGTGSLLFGLSQWFTGGRQVIGMLPEAFTSLSDRIPVIEVPAPVLYVLVVAVVLWIILDYLPAGRYLYVIGDNPRAAELTGIPAGGYITIAFVASGTISALAGITLQAQLQVGQSTVGPEFLLPAATGALLGATTIKPGRPNVWGTVLAVAVLAVAVAGLNQLGVPFFVEHLFNGAMLILAVGLAVQAARRRERTSARADRDFARRTQTASEDNASDDVR